MKNKKILNGTLIATIAISVVIMILSIIDTHLNYAGGIAAGLRETVLRIGEAFSFNKWFNPSYPTINASLIVITGFFGICLLVLSIVISLRRSSPRMLINGILVVYLISLLMMFMANFHHYYGPMMEASNLFVFFIIILLAIGFVTAGISFIISLIGFRVEIEQEKIIEITKETLIRELLYEKVVIEPEQEVKKKMIIINNYYGKNQSLETSNYVDSEEEGMIEAKEEPIKEEVVAETSSEDVATMFENKKDFTRETFAMRLKKSSKELKDIYNEVKAEFLSYGLKSRISRHGDYFRLHCKTYVKIGISGKSLKLYYALDPKDYIDTPIPYKDSSDIKMYEEIPFTFKVRSDLSIKRAKMLMSDVANKYDLVQIEEPKIKNYSHEATLNLDK